MNRLREIKYIILVGSYARGDYTSDSDIDIVVIGGDKKSAYSYIPPQYSRDKISLIYYTLRDWKKIHSNGSLFVFHAVVEGKLLFGNTSTWEALRANFKIKTSFTDDIQKYLDQAMAYVDNPEIAKISASVSMSNIYGIIKNIALFRLAENGIVIFNKVKAIDLYASRFDPVTKGYIQSMGLAYRFHNRNSNQQMVEIEHLQIINSLRKVIDECQP